MSEQITSSKKITVGLILSWLLGLLFAFIGIVSIVSDPIAGLVMLAMAVVLLPPIAKLVDQKWHFHLSSGIKIIIVIVGLIIFGYIASNTKFAGEQNNQPQVKREQQKTTSPTEQTNNKKVGVTPTPAEEIGAPEENVAPVAPKEPEPVVVSFGNGTHIVGTNIKAGTYRSEGTRMCYWARLKGFSGELDDIIANGNNSPEIVTIGSSDAAFQASGCGQWVAIESTYPITPATSFSDGTYEVGKHIASGTYRADGSPDSLCYWARLSNFSHSGVSGIITNGNSPTVIKISGSDRGFTAFGCGNWTKQ